VRTNGVRCQRCSWMPWGGTASGSSESGMAETLKRCRCCRLFVCSWCRRTDVDGCRLRCDGPTPPPVSRKRCRADDAQRFLDGEDNRRAMSLRSAAAPSSGASMVRLLAAAERYEAARDSAATSDVGRGEERGLPSTARTTLSEEEPWDAFADDDEGPSSGEL